MGAIRKDDLVIGHVTIIGDVGDLGRYVVLVSLFAIIDDGQHFRPNAYLQLVTLGEPVIFRAGHLAKRGHINVQRLAIG